MRPPARKRRCRGRLLMPRTDLDRELCPKWNVERDEIPALGWKPAAWLGWAPGAR
jgi:hypothetical protein